jgi:phosphohistidine phosphatase
MSNGLKRRPEHPIHQACAVPYRWRGGELEFCLVTTSRKRRWGFPKGIVDPGETPRKTALKEAWEEAGLRGRVEGRALGQYIYRKWGSRLVVAAYLMRVVDEADDWEEARLRKRRWFPANRARSKLARKGQADLFRLAVERLRISRPVRSPQTPQ